jgi:hypothetical protein
VDAWIAAQPFTGPQKRAAEQLARSMQSEMVTQYKNREEARRAANIGGKAINCIDRTFDYNESNRVFKGLISTTINTRSRILKEDADDEMLSGMAFEVPFENQCE